MQIHLNNYTTTMKDVNSGFKSFRSNTPNNKIIKTSQLSNYQIRETIGNGTYGKVKRALHILTDQNVAVKIIFKNKLSEQELTKIYNEITIQKYIVHQNIIRIYQVIQTLDRIYIFMEYCPNGDIFQYMTKNGPFTQAQAARIFKQVFSALKYLHQIGICHRDIKCQNVMFDKNNNCKLIDFGFAKRYNYGDQLSTDCGSILYSCPQIAMGVKYIPQKADIWSLGIFLYTIVSGQFPFETRDMAKAKYNIISCSYKPQKNFSSPLNQIISQILVEAQKRSSLNDLQKSQFYRIYPNHSPNFINPLNQQEIFDEKIIHQISSKYGISIEEIQNSLKEKKLNSHNSLYYLSLAASQFRQSISKFDINSSKFTKRNKEIKKVTKSYDRNHTLSINKGTQRQKSKQYRKDNQKSFVIKPIKINLNLIKFIIPQSPKKEQNGLNYNKTYRRTRFSSFKK